MRIAVLGAGAIGSALGALLAREGHAVTLIAREEHVRAIREHGLAVDGALGSFSMKVQAVAALDAVPELALLTVKTQDVDAAIRANRPFLEEVPVLTMQNGVRSDGIAGALLTDKHLVSSVVLVTATYLAPGRVTVVDPGSLVLGRPQGPPDPLVVKVARILNPVVPTSLSDNMVGSHWLKLLMNLNNAVPALTNLSLREATRDPFLRKLAVSLMREGLTVADRAGIELAPLDGVPVRTVRLLARMPLSLAARMFASRADSLGGDWPVLGSTLQSLRRGRPTEIDYLNGEIARRGAELGVPTPRNAKVVELVHDIERTGRFYPPGDLRDLLGAPGAG